ncbi:hypothetical protein EC973_009359 [Apophysomyces ossiformis]|uniref:Something about silencing protein 4 domain-containing protein n=1 Tax=Apophysomyces ossiformis TaxID=679940 RepID=A0A8H7BYM4_9FUNG|nr:hypothetical protein EC973_009359 [Apophysomyces ossiformis]
MPHQPKARSHAGHKRALPARHSFLTDAVQAVLENQTKQNEPSITGQSILEVLPTGPIPKDYHQHPFEEQAVETQAGHPLPVPDFIVLSPRLDKQSDKIVTEPIPEDYYLKRHRKHEMEEKKQKNREKERLQHELYQQQQMVDRIRSMDKSTLLSIISSLRHREGEEEEEEGEGEEDQVDVDAVHGQLLRDAEETLRRYEMLGFGRRLKKKPDVSKPPIHTFEQLVLATQRSARRSPRNVMAFGRKVPPMKQTEFSLPKKLFGSLMDARMAKH